MTDKSLHTFAETLDIGTQDISTDGFQQIDYHEARDSFKNYMHATHGMIFSKESKELWGRYHQPANILMQARFDGCFGFPGGLMDQGDSEPVVDALNRELVEEIGLNLNQFKFSQEDFVISHVNHKKKLITHFYSKEAKAEVYANIERENLNAEEWGIETMGLLRVPLFIMEDGRRGFPVFLANRFAGNAKEQLLHTIRMQKLLPDDLLDKVISANEKFMKELKGAS